MSDASLFFHGVLLLPNRFVADGAVGVRNGRIAAVGAAAQVLPGRLDGTPLVDAGDGYLSPGFVDLHVHGGHGADFMDGTEEAFATALSAHARHGTTSIAPTTTAARHDQILAMLDTCRRFKDRDTGGSRVLGAHLYGPYFHHEARGCHPDGPIRAPERREYAQYLELAGAIVTASVAPELPGAEQFTRDCLARGIRMGAGHTHATFAQVADAVRWGIRHVDHLYCAMSDKSKLRQRQPYPMQGGVLEATLYFDELSTEVIADGKHLTADLLLLALKIKGPDRLALVTDCNRALDMPEGPYLFGPLDGGEPFISHDGVGKMPDGMALASSTRGMDHMVRTFASLTGRPLWEIVRMASLTPATIAGHERDIGSLEVGKRADVLVLSKDLEVEQVYLAGRKLGCRMGQ
ncbi:MAG TPA: N-acetylglucosamine-6-phosphate deacetylase [Pirellulales bacterium]|nr:N-acetylglucosamine-6-phosphate deacetylase [Pirellulales bacterium]